MVEVLMTLKNVLIQFKPTSRIYLLKFDPSIFSDKIIFNLFNLYK